MFASVCCAPESDEFTFNFKSNYFLSPLELKKNAVTYLNKTIKRKKESRKRESKRVCERERDKQPTNLYFLAVFEFELNNSS